MRPLLSLPARLLATRRLSRLPRLSSPLRPLLFGGLAYLALRPLLALLRELLVVGLAGLVRAGAEAPIWRDLIARLPVDPVYTLAMVQFVGQIEARGIAVAGLPGAALHAVAAGWFLDPELAEGSWVRAVLEPGATVLARGLVGFTADFASLMIGLALFLAGLRGPGWLAVCGALLQGHVILHQFLDLSISLRDFEAAGLPFAVSAVMSDASQRGVWFTRYLADLPATLVSTGTGLLLTLLAYLLAALALVPPLAAYVLALRARRRPSGWRLVAARLARPRVAIQAVIVLLLVVSPLGAFAESETLTLEDQPTTLTATFQPADDEAEADPARSEGPTPVVLVGGHYQYSLVVGGSPQLVLGMGYNAEYRNRDPAERAQLYDRDFAAMREAGVNVIFGWFQDQFDEVTLDAAHRNGLGVGMPFELNQDLPYDDPAFRERLMADVLGWVRRYRHHPAVWFWTPGNEVIHRLIFPSWLRKQSDPQREARADSFARFYVELIDRIHQVDPDHPVIYRDAEEVYLGRIRDNLLRDGVRRPWFAYGANVYSPRLAEILRDWPRQGLDVPLLVSEYSPGGTGPRDRPDGLRAMWATIRSYPDWVIGGAVYTWTTEGPEELDRIFGLVDGNGRPRDGTLAAVAEAYRREAR